MKKHAYLIMVHERPKQIKMLLQCLDNERTDIFIHIDAKSLISENEFTGICKSSNIYFTKRVRVEWGGYSQIKAEMILLEYATQQGKYEFYHYITGMDMPLYNQNIILKFFDDHIGEEFVGIKSEAKCHDGTYDALFRIKYYFMFQEIVGKSKLRKIQSILILMQKILGIDRLRKNSITIGYGSAYFDISDKFARYIVNKSMDVHDLFKKSLCADELFIQTMYLNAPDSEKGKLHKENNTIRGIHTADNNIKRAIYWNPNTVSPYVWHAKDYEFLKNSKCLFARKVDINVDANIFKIIMDEISCKKDIRKNESSAKY